MVAGYEARLAENGIKIAVSKKYFETEVEQRNTSINSLFVNRIMQKLDEKREAKNGYHYNRNIYHCIVITVMPIDKTLVKKEFCRSYSFILRKVERAHIGEIPMRIEYAENKLLSKIEKRILKILKKAEKQSAQKICKDTFLDACRYSASTKYDYKDRILGKDRYFWEIGFMIAVAVLVVVGFGCTWIITEFF